MTSKISQVLIDSEGVRNQITGHLVDLSADGEPIGYCALGALACEKGLIIKGMGDPNSNVSYEDILKSYGTDPNTIVIDPTTKVPMDLMGLIYRLNDRGNSFKKIGQIIKKMEKDGVIKYED